MTRVLVLVLTCLVQSLFSQVYTEKQSRHRFAQLNLGLDLESSFGGQTKFVNTNGMLSQIDLGSTFTPRFLIGGTHFWGHADFYLAIPLVSSTIKEENQEIRSTRGVETVFKYYPWRIEHHKIRPFVGVSIAPFFFEQRNNNFDYSSGPELNSTRLPLLGGFTFNSKQHLLELGIAWNYANKKDYYISRTQIESITTPPVYVNFSYRLMLETTISAEKNWESGRTAAVTTILANQKKLGSLSIFAK